MGSRGENSNSFTCWEELNLRVSNEVGSVFQVRRVPDKYDGKRCKVF